MVASRDSLIDELNDRVAVFEEDKVVLKAALRQLQKEMKEEAPKTQKLVSELKSANNSESHCCQNDVFLAQYRYITCTALYCTVLYCDHHCLNEFRTKHLQSFFLFAII